MRSKKFILITALLLVNVFICGCPPKDNKRPVIDSFTADPSSGNAPLAVNFTVNAHDPDGNITQYEWDLDANGAYESTTSGNSVGYTYNDKGDYDAKVRVTDNSGDSVAGNTLVKVAQSISFKPSGTAVNNSVYLEEVSKSKDQITLALKVKGGTNVYGAMLEIDFDGSKIKYDSTKEGNYLNQGTAGTTTFSAGLEQGSTGVLLIGVNKKGNVSGVTGDGVLVHIFLKALNTQTNTAVNFNTTNSTLKLPDTTNITGTSFLGGSLSYQ